MWISLTIFINFYCISLSFSHASSDYDAPQEITFYHDLGSDKEPVWVKKESVELNNVNNGNIVVSQEKISDTIMAKIKDKELYRLKSVVKTAKGKETVFYSFMKMNVLAKAGFISSILVHLDQTGSVISVKLYPKKHDHLLQYTGNNTIITFKGSEQGPLPDLTSYLLKLEREREAKEKGTAQDNRSFLAKYWMYIVPLIMFAILSGTSGDAGAGTGAQQPNR